jgi:uncharacterized protein HemX
MVIDEQRKPNKKSGLHETIQDWVAKTTYSCRSIIVDFVEKQTGIWS